METRQTGWVIILAMVVAVLFVSGLALFTKMPGPGQQITLLMIPGLLIPALLFYQLTVKVDRENVSIVFGVGIIRRKWKIGTIEKAEAVRNTVMHGWGIHFSLNTTIYNVSGFDAVELTFRNSKRKVRIGTAEAVKLADSINRQVNENSHSH